MSISANYPNLRPSLNLDFANSKVLDPRITFSRASTATYYDGKTTVKAEENLLLRSQEFDVTPWQPQNGCVITSNTTVAPDGTTTADTATNINAASAVAISQNISLVSGNTYTLSLYAQAGTTTTLHLGAYQGGFLTATPSIYSGPGSVSGTGIVSVSGLQAGSWTRVVLTFTASSTGICAIMLYPEVSATGTGKSVIFWGAQLEQRSTVTAYTPTTSAPITNYIPALQTAAANVARFDHDPVTGESKGLLIEEQRTNLILQSQDFDNAAWTKADATISANSVVAPDGTLTADKLVESSTTAIHYARQAFTFSATAYAFSIYLKAAGRNWAHILAGSLSCYFDLSGGVVGTAAGGTTGTINSVGNGWYRCTITGTATAVADFVYVRTASANNTNNYTGDGYSGIYIWGAQLEAGSFPTSYIGTTTAQVTRSADSASMTGTNFSSWYRADEGTLYGEAAGYSTSNSSIAVLRDSGTVYANQITLDRSSGNAPRFAGNAASVVQFSLPSSGFTAGTFFKLSGAYKVNDFAASFNGASVLTDTSGVVPTSIVQMEIGRLGQSQNEYINGTIKRIAYYPKRLSNTELQSLTS